MYNDVLVSEIFVSNRAEVLEFWRKKSVMSTSVISTPLQMLFELTKNQGR
jgi:hypothetical protein